MTSVRKEVIRYHQEYYSKHKLFESDTWLEKPNAELMSIGKSLIGRDDIRILDLGAGVGRNAIPLAKLFRHCSARIDCVDFLEFAITELKKNVLEHDVCSSVNPIFSDIAEYPISDSQYDLIAGMSVLENTYDSHTIESAITKIQNGTKISGFNCLSIATDLQEIQIDDNVEIKPLLETHLTRAQWNEILNRLYSQWEIRCLNFSPYEEIESRLGIDIRRKGSYCLFIAVRHI